MKVLIFRPNGSNRVFKFVFVYTERRKRQVKKKEIRELRQEKKNIGETNIMMTFFLFLIFFK